MPSAAVPERYRVYGLALRSEIRIEGLEPLAPSDEAPDLDVIRGEVPAEGAEVIAYEDGTRFRIEAHRITTSWTSTAADMATYLLGPVLAVVLRRRGLLVLHASAVLLGGRALILCGAPGMGKSTTAAALVQSGARAVTDDVAAIVRRDGVPHVEAGYPRLRLWSDSAEGLYGTAEALPLLTPTWEKRFLDTRGCFVREAVAVGAVGVLAAREERTTIRTLSGHEAVMSVLARTSVPLLLEETLRGEELELLSGLVAAVPVFEVRVRDDLGAIGEVVAALQEAAAW
ncbi:MAG TPA: hypothetical protein VEK57_24225 [Thermoanaerobaculia bacterium]|nr:hypothetical protein [Thermoanaerobaculia bacterium]